MNIPNELYLVCWLLGNTILCTACSDPTMPQSINSSIPSQGTANPATQKCIADDHTLETVQSSTGVPISHICVNKKNGKKCEEWAYLRGECQL
jgi:putative hemolysin